MSMFLFFVVPVALIFASRRLADRALDDVISIEGDRYIQSEVPKVLNWARSIGRWRLMWDERLPRPSYPAVVVKRINRARAVYYSAIIVWVLSLVSLVICLMLGSVDP